MTRTNPIQRFAAGSQLRIREGTFAGLLGELAETWSGEEIARVRLVIFGRPVLIEIDPWWVEPPLFPPEAEWPPGTSLSRMLSSPCTYGTERQLQLFAAACCRRIFHLISEDRCRKLIEEANRFLPSEEQAIVPPNFLMQTVEKMERRADGDAVESLKEEAIKAHFLTLVSRLYPAGYDRSSGPFDHELMAAAEAAGAVAAACAPSARGVAQYAAQAVSRAAGGEGDGSAVECPAETAAQCDLVRDIFGRPLHLTEVGAAWLTPTVTQLAQSIYEDRAFEWLPILGDALEDAGCDNAAILDHVRGPGPHARGCWVLDLLTGKTCVSSLHSALWE